MGSFDMKKLWNNFKKQKKMERGGTDSPGSTKTQTQRLGACVQKQTDRTVLARTVMMCLQSGE